MSERREGIQFYIAWEVCINNFIFLDAWCVISIYSRWVRAPQLNASVALLQWMFLLHVDPSGTVAILCNTQVVSVCFTMIESKLNSDFDSYFFLLMQDSRRRVYGTLPHSV